MPISRWLPSLARSCSQSASDRSLTCLAPSLGQAGRLDPGGQDRPVRDEVGVDAGVWLDVGVRRTEQLLGVLGGYRLDGVDVLAAGVEAVPDGALGVLVGEPGAHGEQHRGRGVVLAGDQLQRISLIGKLFARRGGDARFDRFDDLQDVSVGGARGVGVLGAGSGGGGTSRSRGSAYGRVCSHAFSVIRSAGRPFLARLCATVSLKASSSYALTDTVADRRAPRALPPPGTDVTDVTP